MKKSKRRIVSALLTASMLFGSAVTAMAGGDTMAPREGEQGHLGENQPTYHGHRAYDVLNWSPETDEYSRFMKSNVPLQERNEAFNATQANPLLDQKVQSLSLTEDYGNEFFNPYQYNDDFSQYVFNFWQYQDIRASWHGTVTDPTPDSLFDPEAGWWERNYEFGVVNIPNPAYTNAAHKNGVMSIGCIFFPRAEHTDDWVFQDEEGNFPMADKLVEMAKWYGFDGYFINAEEALPSSFMPMYEEFCRAMTSQGIYIQVYASNLYGQNNESSWGRIDYYNKSASAFSNWIKGVDDDTIAANSLYMNPGPSVDMVNTSVSSMEALGLDARETVFQTLEAGQTGFSGVRGSLNNLMDENLVPRTGIANLGAGTVWAHLDEQVFGHTGNNSYSENRRGSADYQKYVFARERTWWSGAADQPYYANDNSYIVQGVSFLDKPTTQYTEAERQQLLRAILDATTDPYATANDPTRGEYDGYSSSHGQFQSWPGMAAFISERSVINGANFYTSFNTGHGMQYFVDGKVSNNNEWCNINVQDLLPTWQWWIETDSENRLGMDFDYGSKYNAGYDYKQLGGYEGSSSLAIFGTVDAKSDIHLYKTDLAINEDTKLNLTYNKPSKTDDSTFSVVLYLADGENVKTVYVPVKNANRATNGWVKTTLDLSAYAGETIAAFGVSVNTNGSAISGYQMNLGELSITDNAVAPEAPTGFAIDRKFDTDEVYLSWDLDDYEDVQKYNVYAVYADGTETYVGGSYDDCYYVKNTMYDADKTVAFKLTSEGRNGVESDGATVDYGASITGLTVTEAAGVLNVSWDAPARDFASIRADVILPDNYAGNTNTYSSVFAPYATSGSVAVPVADGSRYILRLSYLDEEGNTVTYADHSGFLPDLFCDSYAGGLQARVQSGGWKLLNPQVYDWWHLYAWRADGTLMKFKDNRTYAIRGVDDLTSMPVSGDFGYIEVQLEDFAGNLSEKTRVYWGAETKAVDETVFPDAALLAAVQEQVGETMDKVLAFDGTLDLSGKEVSDLTGLANFSNLTVLNLSNTSVAKISNLPTSLKEINVSNCAALQILDLSNSNVERILCDDAAKLENLTSVLLHDARLDLTEGTAEQIFVEAAKKLTEGKQDIISTADNESNLAENGTAIAGDGKLFDGDTSGYLYVNDGAEFVVDLGSTQTVERWELFNYSSYYKINGFTLSVSDDNETYTEVLTKDGISNATESEALETPATGRYFKVKVSGSSYIKEFKLFGHATEVYPAGVNAANQRPIAYLTVPASISYEYSEDILDLATLPTYATTRGTDFAALKEADFIAEDYDIDAQLTGGAYDVIYTNDAASSEISLAKAGTYNVSYVKFGVENTTYETVVTVGEKADPCAKFTDIVTTEWYHDGVHFVLENGLMVGTSDTTFSPYGNLSRGQLAAILYRLAGAPEVTAKVPFTDVPANMYYANAITWAYENKIVYGIGNDKYNPEGSVTRQDMVAILYRYAEFAGYDLTTDGDLTAFPDAGKVADYAVDAMTWAVANKVIYGNTSNGAIILDPVGTANRAQFACVLTRLVEMN